MDYLPDCVLLHIFSYLDAASLCKVRRVCIRWNRISTDEILWQHKLLSDINRWRQVSNQSYPDQNSKSTSQTNLKLYLNGCPDILKWKAHNKQKTTFEQMSELLRYIMPTRRYFIAMGGPGMDCDETSGIIRKLLQFDAGNVFQSCGQFPGRYQGVGGGFLLKYKLNMLELCLMYCAPREQREFMNIEERIERLETVIRGNQGYQEMLQALGGYIFTINSTITEQCSEDQVVADLIKLRSELAFFQSMRASVPLLVLSLVKEDGRQRLSSYKVAQTLQLQTLQRPWMVADSTCDMVYRDILEPMDWLLAHMS